MSDEIISKALGLPTIASYEIDPEDDIIDDMDSDETILENNEEDELDETDEMAGEIITASPNEISISYDPELMKDIDDSKVTLSKMVRAQHEAFETLILLAVQTENPRAFEVASKMMIDTANTLKAKVELSEKKSGLKNSGGKNNSVNNTTNNNTLIISTTDLLKAITSKESKN